MARSKASPDILGTTEAAQLLRVSSATLKRWAQAGLIPCECTAGGHRRYRRSDVERFAVRHADRAPAERLSAALWSSHGPLAMQALLLRERGELGSWWAVAEALAPLVDELRRRREAGIVTAVQWREAVHRLERAVHRFVDQAPPALRAPAALVATAPAEPFLLDAVCVELGAVESGWAVRWGGHATAKELAAELERRRPEAVVAVAGPASDPVAVGYHARELEESARRAAVPLAFAGSGPWPEPSPEAARLRGFLEVGVWLDRLRANGDGPSPATDGGHSPR